MGVQQSVKTHARPPAGAEVRDVDMLVAVRLSLTPEKQGVLRRFLFARFFRILWKAEETPEMHIAIKPELSMKNTSGGLISN